MRSFPLLVCAWLAAACASAASRSVLVISVDGLDHRYLRDADKLGLKIPNLRRLMREGAWADGVVGVVPTITWPSHTTMISGVPPYVHGILGNRRPQADGGEYYWSASLLKSPTLLDAARKKGMTTAAITWPVTVDAPVDYNLPEFFRKRNGGAMDLASIEEKGTQGLVEEIAKRFPSFPQGWMDDRTRAQATIFLLEEKKPKLTLVHFVDHDAEAHEHGPFTREANALVEYTDELLGLILKAMPKDMVLALVSDHGFERTDKTVNLSVPLEAEGVKSGALVTPFLVVATTPAAAEALRKLASRPEYGIGREVPVDELKRFAPEYKSALAAWESAEHFAFGADARPREKGNHGLWPMRPDYRSTFLLWGAGVKSARLPEMQMTGIAGRLASILELELSPAAR